MHKAPLGDFLVMVWEGAEWYGSTGLDTNKVPLVVVCKFCGFNFSFRRDRCLAHLGWICGATKQPQIKKCTNVPPTTKALFRTCGGIFPRNTVEEEVHLTPPMHQDDVAGSQGQGSCAPVPEFCDQINVGECNTHVVLNF